MSILARLLELFTPARAPLPFEDTPSGSDAPVVQRASGTDNAPEASNEERDASKDPDHERDLLLMLHICC